MMRSVAAVYVFGIFSPFSAHSTYLRQSPVFPIPSDDPPLGSNSLRRFPTLSHT